MTRKHWKYNPADVDARRRWSDYQAAYAEALARCGTPQASVVLKVNVR